MYKIAAILFFVLNSYFSFSQEIQVIPLPKQCNIIDSKYFINTNFSISVTAPATSRVYDAATRMLVRLKGRTGIFITQYRVFNDYPDATMNIIVEKPGENILNEDESYTLTIDSRRISLKSKTDLGAMHGLETLLQLLQLENGNYYFPGCTISDSPRFAWRGLLIDVGRHFMPVDVIKHNIDGMAAVKMNVLHFHLSEDQGFRIECKAFPKLHQLGSDGQYFTQEQIKDIIAYADARGIRVVPEFDMPGHASSWFVGYPELASGKGQYSVEDKFGVLLPTMNPAQEKTYQFLDTFLREMTTLFPDQYFHIGGDENNGKEWDANPSIQEFKQANNLADNNALQAYFNKRILEILNKYGKKMVGWDEIMQPQLPKEILIQSWRKGGLVESVRNGFPVILSKGYYIDLAQPAELHYKTDPLPDTIALTDDQKKLVIGGEATMWTEMATEETIDSRIWPRTAAIAERLWSPSTVTNVASMYKRMDRISIQLEELGLTHEKNYEMILRRICGSYDILALKTLVDVLEPVKNYHRIGSKDVHYTTHSPFSRIADAARPDTRVARTFNALVDTFLKNKSDKKLAGDLRGYLKVWSNNHQTLEQLFQQIPAVKEVEPLSKELEEISRIGLQALVYLKTNKSSKGNWKRNSLGELKQATKSHGQAEIAVISGIRQLVEKVR
jgi:hexosaminidase